MEEIKVGDYVRTKDGFIYKIEDGEEFYEDSIDVGIGVIPDIDGIWVDKGHFCYVERRNIVKHSKLISEVIEVGDYVNGKLIHKIDKGPNYCYLYYGNSKTFVNYQIKSIVTKEMMKSIEYRIN